MPAINSMITVPVDNFNTFSQKFYDSVLLRLQLHRLQCTCGHSGCLGRHGRYTRSVITEDGKVSLRILRLRCSDCGKTHAILPASIVPYCQVMLTDQHQVVCAFEAGGNRNVVCQGLGTDENNVKSIIRRYRHFWRQRLLSESIGLAPLQALICDCFSFYQMQFMQIRTTVNKLFLIPT